MDDFGSVEIVVCAGTVSNEFPDWVKKLGELHHAQPVRICRVGPHDGKWVFLYEKPVSENRYDGTCRNIVTQVLYVIERTPDGTLRSRDIAHVNVCLDGGVVSPREIDAATDHLQLELDVSGWQNIRPTLASTDQLVLSTEVSGFMSPRPSFVLDRLGLSASLDGGGLQLVIVTAPSIEDRLSLIPQLDSGTYSLVIVAPPSMEDRMMVAPSLDGGTYLAVVVPVTAPEDRMTLTCNLDSGVYTFVVGGIASVEDRVSLSLSMEGVYG